MATNQQPKLEIFDARDVRNPKSFQEPREKWLAWAAATQYEPAECQLAVLFAIEMSSEYSITCRFGRGGQTRQFPSLLDFVQQVFDLLEAGVPRNHESQCQFTLCVAH